MHKRYVVTLIQPARRSLAAAAALAAWSVLADTAVAHHSFSIFDMNTEVALEGEVVEFQWTSPHTWTRLNVTDDNGNTTEWELEGMSPDFLGRRGWNKNTLKAGDRIQVVIFPLKSGEPGGTFVRTTLPDGTLKVMFGRAP